MDGRSSISTDESRSWSSFAVAHGLLLVNVNVVQVGCLKPRHVARGNSNSGLIITIYENLISLINNSSGSSVPLLVRRIAMVALVGCVFALWGVHVVFLFFGMSRLVEKTKDVVKSCR
jgi:hypothetical protein